MESHLQSFYADASACTDATQRVVGRRRIVLAWCCAMPAGLVSVSTSNVVDSLVNCLVGSLTSQSSLLAPLYLQSLVREKWGPRGTNQAPTEPDMRRERATPRFGALAIPIRLKGLKQLASTVAAIQTFGSAGRGVSHPGTVAQKLNALLIGRIPPTGVSSLSLLHPARFFL